LHNHVILLLPPESFRVFHSCANQGFCYLNLAGISKYKCERRKEKDSGLGSKMMPSCKWPISVVLFSESDYPTIYKLFPRAAIKFIPDSRHWLIIEKPKEFAQTVMEFLAKDTADHQF